jgi:hypothetical protein
LFVRDLRDQPRGLRRFNALVSPIHAPRPCEQAGSLHSASGTDPATTTWFARRQVLSTSRKPRQLRTRGQDRDWLVALVDYLHDTKDHRSESVRGGLDELARGDLEPA